MKPAADQLIQQDEDEKGGFYGSEDDRCVLTGAKVSRRE